MRVVLADDEPLLRFHLQKALENVWPEADILAQAANGEEAIALITELKPDVAFLDIQMPGLTGLEVALQLAKEESPTKVVFLTAYDQYAVEAFDRGAIDYLLKPLDENRLAKTVERLKQQTAAVKQQTPELESLVELIQKVGGEQSLTWLNVQHGSAIKVLAVSDILCFKAEDKYTTVVTADGEYLVRLSIKELEQRLDPNVFWRIHRSTLLNISYLDRVEKTEEGQLEAYVKGCKKPLTVSRAKQNLFKIR